MHFRRSISIVAVAALALAGVVAAPLAATAAPGDDVLVFSNSNVVDTSSGVGGGEYEWISASITSAGYDVFPFDGGDGSQSAWEAALVGIEVFVLPEQEEGNFYDPGSPPSWLSADAFSALVAWIQGGGVAIISGMCSPNNSALLNGAVGVDYTDVFLCNDFASADRYISDAALPSTLPYASAVPTIDLSTMSNAQRAPLTVWYAADGACGVGLAAGEFDAGSGRVDVLAWDWFNDTGADQTGWNTVLASMLDGNANTSTWTPPAPPAPKSPISATTTAGEQLYTVSQGSCNPDSMLYRVDPGTALAYPVGATTRYGMAGQAAWNPLTHTAYVPFDNWDEGRYELLTVDLGTGGYTFVGEFSLPGDDYVNSLYSLAIGRDGAAYLYAWIWDDSFGDYRFALMSVDLSTAALSIVAFPDDSQLNDPSAFAVDPTTGYFYAFEEDTWELFRINVTTGAATPLGVLDSAAIDESSDVTSLQIGSDGTFWVVFSIPGPDNWPGYLSRFKLSDISGGLIHATDVGLVTDAPIPAASILLTWSVLAPTGAEVGILPLGALVVLMLGAGLVVVARLRRRRTV